MSFFSKLFGNNKNPNSYAFRLERAKSLHGQVVKYVTENRDGNEDVIGRGGSLCLHGETFIVDSTGATASMPSLWKTYNSNSASYYQTYPSGFNRTLRIKGMIDKEGVIYQQFFTGPQNYLDDPGHYAYITSSVSGTYIVSGFAKAVNQTPSDSGIFRLRVEVKYYSGSQSNLTTQNYYFDFNKSTEQWQYVCGTFTIDSSRPVHSVRLYGEYSYQTGGYALFDNLSVIKSTDDSVNFSTYYDEGYIKSTITGNHFEMYAYDINGNMIKAVNNRNEYTEYGYDSKGNLTSETNYTYVNTDSWTSWLDFHGKTTLTPKTKSTYAYDQYGLCTSHSYFEGKYNNTGDGVVNNGNKSFYTQTSYVTTLGSRAFGAV